MPTNEANSSCQKHNTTKLDYEKDEKAMLKLCNPKHNIKTLFKINVS
jgi:hypothetical protein